MMHCHNATAKNLLPKFGANSLRIFTHSPQNVTALCRIDCLACQKELFMNAPFDVKENNEHAFDFPYHRLAFLVLVSFNFSIQTSMYGSCFLP
jgi:hypothetical protein